MLGMLTRLWLVVVRHSGLAPLGRLRRWFACEGSTSFTGQHPGRRARRRLLGPFVSSCNVALRGLAQFVTKNQLRCTVLSCVKRSRVLENGPVV